MNMAKKYTLGVAAVATMMALTGAATADLIDHYEFEGNGADSAGGNANGVVGFDVSFAPGVFGQAAVFGDDQSSGESMIRVPQSDAFDPGFGDFSFAFWAKRDEADSMDADGVFDALDLATTGYQCNFRGFEDEHYMAFRLDDDFGQFVLIMAQTPMPDTTAFHHYSLTVDRSGDTARLYIDGILDATVDVSILDGSISPSQELQIGGINENNPLLGMDGRLDDLRFYNHMLTTDEIQDLMGGGGSCRPDLNDDGVVNTQDFLAFLNLWANGDPIADWNGDGIVNTQDFLAFLNDWAAGCP